MVAHYDCAICGLDRPQYTLRPAESRRSWNIIMLSCLARHNIISIEEALSVYKAVSSGGNGKAYYCKNHYIDAAVLLGQEIEQLGGEFPFLGLSEVPRKILNDFVGILRACGKLLDNELELHVKDIMDFYLDCLYKFHTKIRERHLRRKRAIVQDDASPMGDFAESDAVVPPKKQKPLCGDSDLPSHSTVRRYTCALCDVPRLETEVRDSSKNRRHNLILFSSLFIENSIDDQFASKVYDDISRRRKRLCKEHYIRACTFIANEIKQVSGIVPIHGLDCVPMENWQGIFEKIKEFSTQFDKTLPLEPIDIIRFYDDCLATFRTSDGWNAFAHSNNYNAVTEPSTSGLFSQEGCKSEPAENSTVDACSLLASCKTRKVEDESGTENADQPSQCVPNLPSKRSLGNDLPHCKQEPVEELDSLFCNLVGQPSSTAGQVAGGHPNGSSSAVMKGQDSVNNRPESESNKTGFRGSSEDDELHDDSRPRNRACSLCGVVRVEDESRSGSTNIRQNLVLISCLLMSNIAKMESAKEICEGILYKRRRLCKLHYIQAANWIGEEVEKAWGKFPIHGLFGIPRKTLTNVLARLQYCIAALGVEERLGVDDLAWFYGDCLAKYRQMDGWKVEALQNKEEIAQASLEAIQTILAEATPANCPSNLVQNPTIGMLQSKDVEIKSGRRLTCAICGVSWPHYEMRYSAFNRPQNAMLLSSLVIKGSLALESARHLYATFEAERKYLCKSHYVEAATFVNEDLKHARSPSDSSSTTPDVNSMDLLPRLQSIAHILDKDVTLRTCDLVRFGGEFVANYRKELAEKKRISAIEQILNPFLKTEEPSTLNAAKQRDIKTEAGTSGHHANAGCGDRDRESANSSDSFEKCRTYCCALCGVFQPLKELCMTTVPYSRTLIMLAYSLKSNVITPDSARKFYEDIFRTRQRVCQKHFRETAAYISGYIKKACGSVPQGGLSDVPPDVVSGLLEDVHAHLSEVEEFMSLEYGDVTNFLDFCPPKVHFRDGWGRSDSDKDEETSRDCNYLEETHTVLWESPEHEEQGTSDEACLESDDSESTDSEWEPDMEKSKFTCRPPERPGYVTFGCKSVPVEQVQLAIAFYRSVWRGARPFCSMMNRFAWIQNENHLAKLRLIEKKDPNPRTSLSLYRAITSGKVQLAIAHYRSVQRGARSFYSMMKRFRWIRSESHIHTLRRHEKKGGNYVAKFKSECEKSTRSKSRGEKSSFFTLRENDSDKNSPRASASDATATSNAKSSDINGGKIYSLRKTFCALCGTQHEPEDMRRPSQEAQHTMLLLACLCIQELIKLPRKKKLYVKPRDVQGRLVCESHYIQAAAFIGKETECMWGDFPREGLSKVPQEILNNLVKVIRVYSDKIDNEVVITTSDLVNFFDDCLARYYRSDKWERPKTQTDEPSSNDAGEEHATIAPDPGSLFVDERKVKAELHEGISAEDLLRHSVKHEEESHAPEDTKPSCSTYRSVNCIHSSENPNPNNEQCLEPADPIQIEDDSCEKRLSLTEEQQYNRLRNCASLLQRSSKEVLLSRLVTSGERWILYDDKIRTASCVKEGELPSRLKSHQSKRLVIVWWSAAGVIHYAFCQECETMTVERYCEELTTMHKKLLERQPALFDGKCPAYLHDDRSTYNSITIKKLYELGYEVLMHPSQSSDLLPSEYHLFPKFNEYLHHQVLKNANDVEGALQLFLKIKTKSFFSTGINKLVSRWKKCLEANGDYFDE